jgi:hypothetical protein
MTLDAHSTAPTCLVDTNDIRCTYRRLGEEVGPHDNLRTITAAAHKVSIRVFIVPQNRWEPGDLEGCTHPNPDQVGGA